MTDDSDIEKRIRAKLLGGTTARGRREVIVPQADRDAARKKQEARRRVIASRPDPRALRYEHAACGARYQHPWHWTLYEIVEGVARAHLCGLDPQDLEAITADLRARHFRVDPVGTVLAEPVR